MNKKVNMLKATMVAFACGGIPLVTAASCDPYYGMSFFRDDDSDYYYDDYYYDDYYCDPFYCF